MYGGVEYAGGPYGGTRGNLSPATTTDLDTKLAVEVSFTTGPLDTPVWVDITPDVRSWSTSRGRSRELERFQPGRATVVLSNLSRQYDSLHTANIKPMKRMRIRETFNGVTYPVFDGYVDKWTLDYPNFGKDATATLTATDMSKILARVEFEPSVYHDAVTDDGADVYWRLDEQKNGQSDTALRALNWGALQPNANGTYTGPPELGREPLVVKDPGGSIGIVTSTAAAGTPGMGVLSAAADFALFTAGTESFAFEGWCIPRNTPGSNGYLLSAENAAGTVKVEILYTLSQTFVFNVNHTTPVSLSTSPTTFVPHQRYHVVAKCVVGETLKLWINGVQFTGGTPAGTLGAGPGITRVGFLATASPSVNWSGEIAHTSFYRGARASAIDQTWVDRHYAAGTAPWNADLPGARIGRALDEAAIPSDLRELDKGLTTFQSAKVEGQTALEHVQKSAESEYASLVFINREGKVRFIGRTAVLGREPYPIAFGDSAGEIGYRGFIPDDGDENIRNRATISRLDGVAMTATDATSVDSYETFEYVLDGLFHNSEQGSLDYASFIVDQHGEQRRRVRQLEVGPAISGDEDLVYPAMLGQELGSAITVKNIPVGGGSLFSQVCVVEGIEHTGYPGGERTCRFILSPEYPIRTLEDQDVSTLGYAQVTADQTSISAEVDLTGLTSTVTVGTSRRVRVTGCGQIANDGTAGRVIGRIFEGATEVGRWVVEEIAASGFVLGCGSTVLTPSAGSHTYKLKLWKQSGAGTLFLDGITEAPAYILVEDIGPA